MPSEGPSRRPVAYKNMEWMIPSDRMVLRRYKPLRYFSDTLEKGFRAGQAAGYEAREGQVSERARETERQQSEQAESIVLNNGEEMDLAKGMEDVRQEARHNYYASCWRLGTDEDREIWNQYADLVEGVAIETTYHQLEEHLAPDEDDLLMGIVRYLDYETEITPGRSAPLLYFYKHRVFDSEQEFRVLANHGGNPIMWTDGRDPPEEMRSDNPEAVNLPADMDALINRVILAPEAGEEIRAQVEEILDEQGVSAPVVPSRLANPAAHQDTYDAEMGGAANYGGSKEYLEELFRRYADDTDWDLWDTIDLVQLNRKGNLHPRAVFIECYRYPGEAPDRSEYGQEHLNYEVRAHRYKNGDWVNTFWNDSAEETDGLSE